MRIHELFKCHIIKFLIQRFVLDSRKKYQIILFKSYNKLNV